jgi:hypothetical protein
MTRRGPALALVSCCVLGMGCGAGDETKSGGSRSPERTLRIVLPPPGTAGVDGDFTPIFHGRKPFADGDSFVRWDKLTERSYFMTHCVVARQPPPRSTFQCTDTFVLPEGQIVAVGDMDDQVETLPVVGGTGAFEGARGTARSTRGRRGGVITIRLR